MKSLWRKLMCFLFGHVWPAIYVEDDHYVACGVCRQCGKVSNKDRVKWR